MKEDFKIINWQREKPETAKPSYCLFEITDRCMFKCKTCYKWKEKPEGKYPTFHEWKKSISSLRGMLDDGFLINFDGGEPLAMEGFLELVNFAKKIGFNTNFTTNAYLIDEEISKRINDSGVDYINISLDSLDEDKHDYLRGVKGAYRKVMEAIECLDRFCGNNVQIGINCVIYDVNLNGILKIANWVLQNEKLKWIKFSAAMQPEYTPPDTDWHKTGKHAFLWPKDSNRIQEVIDELIKLKKQVSKINNEIFQLEDFKSYYKWPDKFISNKLCNFGRNLYLNAAGDIFLCNRKEKISNIKEDDLRFALCFKAAECAKKNRVNCKNNCYFPLNFFRNQKDTFDITDNKPEKIDIEIGIRESDAQIEVRKQYNQTKEVKEEQDIVKPEFCCLGITDKCMLKCRMCHKWKPVLEDNPTAEQYKNFINTLRELVDEDFQINFGGGEALLFEGLLDLVNFSVKKGFWTNIASNGWLIDEKMAEKIGESGLNEINISLDSTNENTHDYLRGIKGVYQRAMNAIDYLNKYANDTKIGICSVIYDINLDELTGLLEWVNNSDKIDWIYLMAAMQPNNTSFDREWWKGEHGFLWPKNAGKACFFIDTLIKLKRNGYKIGNTIVQLEAFKSYFQFPDRFVKKTKCNLGRAVHVSAVGDIFLCFRWDKLGNIKNGDDIRKIWHSEKAKNIRREITTCHDNCHFLLNCFFEGDYPFALE